MALPGETTCRAVAECGPGKWGDIPVDEKTQFVDAAYGGDSDGSEDKPWATIQAAVDAAAAGTVIAIAEGEYHERVVIDHPVSVWGVCPDKVRVVGPKTNLSTFRVEGAGTELHQISISGTYMGVHALAPTTVDACRLHDSTLAGLWAELAGEVTVRDSRFDHNQGVHVYFDGTDTTVRDCHLSDAMPYADDGTEGRGVWGHAQQEGSTAKLTVSGTVIERSLVHGISLYGVDAVIEDSVVRDTRTKWIGGDAGVGIVADSYDADRGQFSSLVVRRSVVEGSRSFGIAGYSANVTVEAVTVVDTTPDDTGAWGIGVMLTPDGDADAGTRTLTVRGSFIRDSHVAAIFVEGYDAHIESTAVDTVWATEEVPDYGAGVFAVFGSTIARRPQLLVRGSEIRHAQTLGLVVAGGDAVVEAIRVRHMGTSSPPATLQAGIASVVDGTSGQPSTMVLSDALVERPRPIGVLIAGEASLERIAVVDAVEPNEPSGGAITFLQTPATLQPTIATLKHCFVDNAVDAGIIVVGANVTIEGCHVRDVFNHRRGGLGRGLHIQPQLGVRSQVTLRGSVIERTVEAGIASIGATLTVEDSVVSDTVPRSDGEAGTAISAIPRYKWQLASELTIRNSWLARSSSVGVYTEGTALIVEDSVIIDVAPAPTTGFFGDGILTLTTEESGVVYPGSALIRNTRIAAAARAGVASFSADVVIESSTLECNAIHLDAEHFGVIDAQFRNNGGNVCGCDGMSVPCQALSSGLTPPKGITK